MQQAYDYLRLYEGKSRQDDMIAFLTGDMMPGNISSCGNEMHVAFHSNKWNDDNDIGYYAKIHVSESNCSTNITTKECEFSYYVGDGYCDDVTNNAICDYDGGDCCGTNINTCCCTQCQCLDPTFTTTNSPSTMETSTVFSGCYNTDWQGDGACDDQNNHVNCTYDGGDCCGDSVDKTYCTQCQCLDPNFANTTFSSSTIKSSSTSTTPLGCVDPIWYNDGFCDDQNNFANCTYDGGDCCGDDVDTAYCTQCQCLDPSFSTSIPSNSTVQSSSTSSTIEQTYSTTSGCPAPSWEGNGFCNDLNNIANCAYDGGDCCGDNVNTAYCDQCQCLDPTFSTTSLLTTQSSSTIGSTTASGCFDLAWQGDGFCDDNNNIASCAFDGGDCCGDNVDTSYCTECQCLDPSFSTKISIASNDEVPKNKHSFVGTHISQFLKSHLPGSLHPMLCPGYATIGNEICDEVNNILVCQYDGGDCTMKNFNFYCTTFNCTEDKKLDPCPNYNNIGDGKCDMDNFNPICSYDGGDCKVG